MGVLWYDSTKIRALASFESGIVYKGDGYFREQIGTYTSEVVRDSHGTIVAKFNGNTAYNPLFLSIEGYCTFDSNRIYKGGSTWNDTIAIYDGDPYGACAAAVLYFGLHLNNEQSEHVIRNLSSNNKNNNNKASSGTGVGGGGCSGGVVVLIYFVVAFIFYAAGGLNHTFGQESGRQVFFICMACSVVSGIVIYRSKSINGFLEIAVCVLCSNIVAYFIVLLIAFVDGANQGILSFGMVIILLIGGAIGTIGVSSLFCLIEIPVVFIAKSIKDKSNK